MLRLLLLLLLPLRPLFVAIVSLSLDVFVWKIHKYNCSSYRYIFHVHVGPCVFTLIVTCCQHHSAFGIRRSPFGAFPFPAACRQIGFSCILGHTRPPKKKRQSRKTDGGDWGLETGDWALRMRLGIFLSSTVQCWPPKIGH